MSSSRCIIDRGILVVMDVIEPTTSASLALNFTNPKYGIVSCELWFNEATEVCEHVANLCTKGKCDLLTADALVPKEFIRFPLRQGLSMVDLKKPRLEFCRRGLLVYDNDSCSLILTLGPCRADGWYVMGRVVSTGFYNLFLFDEALVEDSCPVYKIEISSVTIIDRQGVEICSTLATKRPERSVPIAEQKLHVRKTNATLLSFQGSDEEAEERKGEVCLEKIKSSHDVLDDPRLAKESVCIPEPPPTVDLIADELQPMSTLEQHSKPLNTLEPLTIIQSKATNNQDIVATVADNNQDWINTDQVEGVESVVDSTINHFLTLHPKSRMGKRRAGADSDTLLALNSFCTKLRSSKDDHHSSTSKQDNGGRQSGTVVVCRLHGLVSCGSCVATFGVAGEDDGEDLNGSGWMRHKLHTDKPCPDEKQVDHLSRKHVHIT